MSQHGAGAQGCWSMGCRAPGVVSMVLRVTSELLRQEEAKTNDGLWGETDHKGPGMVRWGGDHCEWLLVRQGLESRS